ncbi:aromatic ring-hydroxylating oxygenase subunit alpha [Biformimicrobium ophioploci]|uniref:Aromatic ring-hydroxylating dioxygenase subunit alpha n=1 Tax=Biformimicrobium ophioploci TaxID=3036711 RepID=A0ABQ6M211_9GAMM|nr:aromatic ring-hydroxylating dioxygenase subunit alpha [Microbulbifer sp. NKW57]GMG88380.1 aromatic ring-hydroxylating dioxygenase subunit alpha [Microbulbifer sp. NKW57]
MDTEVTTLTAEQIAARSPGTSYQELLDKEVNPVPDCLRDNTNPYLGSENISVDRYLSREFHQLEVEHVWKRTWQAVCRETEVCEPGDTFVYDIVNMSVIVTRTEQGELKAFRNACLHRGRQLVDKNGNYKDLRCPYHAFTWSLDGGFKGAPCKWDFQHINEEEISLPEVKVGTWGGWVFINMDRDAQPLSDYLGILPSHFERWKPENAYKMIHVEKVIPCNWKVGWEAFIESYHAVATHPQILPYTADADSQYDVWGDHISRTITALGVPSHHLKALTDQDVVDNMLGVSAMVAGQNGARVPEGMTAREYIAHLNSQEFSGNHDRELASFATNSERMDSILYSIFPNFAPWAGFHPNITYRFRPNGNDHTTALMEIIVLCQLPSNGERPKDTPVRRLGENELFSEAPELGESLGTIFDQDLVNMPMVQKGMENVESGELILANYHEVRIRHFHQTIDKYINGEL